MEVGILTTKTDFCSECPINKYTEGYVPLQLGSGSELWVGEAAGEEESKSGKPFVGGAGSWLNSMLRSARIARSTINIINTIGCHPPNNAYPGSDKWTWTDRTTAYAGVRYCRQHHLEPALIQIKPSRIVALGEEAMNSLTGRSGVTLWRGSPLPLRGLAAEGPRVVPTLHPAYLMRQPGMFSVAVRDLRRGLELPPEDYNLYPTIEQVRQFQDKRFAFDFEWDEWSNITMCGLSARPYTSICVPFVGEFVEELQRIFETAEIIIGHNIVDADTAYFEKLGWNVTAKLHDTMLAQHLVQPDYRHGLAFVASVFTNKVFWKGKGEESEDDAGNVLPTGAQWRTWDSPDAIPREFGGYGGCVSSDEAWRLYNARDTDASLQAEDGIFRLLRQFGQENTYWNVSLPAAHICRGINEKGLRIDHTRLEEIRTSLENDIRHIETTLPEGLAPYEKPIIRTVPAPTDTWKPKTKICKGTRKLPHDPQNILFNSPGESSCKVCGRVYESGKMGCLKRIKIPDTKRIVPWNSQAQVIAYATSKGCKPIAHVKTGNSSADKRARKIWGRDHTEFAVVDSLKKLITQRNSFAKDGLLGIDWVKFRLSITGTSEGRLACRGVYPANLNLQNQPKIIRKIFIPDQPGS
jgi:uracil-DNA glycosylase